MFARCVYMLAGRCVYRLATASVNMYARGWVCGMSMYERQHTYSTSIWLFIIVIQNIERTSVEELQVGWLKKIDFLWVWVLCYDRRSVGQSLFE
jgi:hypothetical protein